MLNLTELWFRAFAITLGVELAVAVPLLGSAGTLGRRTLAVGFAQLSTHPAVWFVFPELGLARVPYLALAEGFAVVAELVLYRLLFPALSWSQALATSALANAASYTVGLLLK